MTLDRGIVSAFPVFKVYHFNALRHNVIHPLSANPAQALVFLLAIAAYVLSVYTLESSDPVVVAAHLYPVTRGSLYLEIGVEMTVIWKFAYKRVCPAFHRFVWA